MVRDAWIGLPDGNALGIGGVRSYPSRAGASATRERSAMADVHVFRVEYDTRAALRRLHGRMVRKQILWGGGALIMQLLMLLICWQAGLLGEGWPALITVFLGGMPALVAGTWLVTYLARRQSLKAMMDFNADMASRYKEHLKF